MMLTASQLAARINAAVQAAGTGMASEMGELAKEYTRITLFATQRINACAVLLSRGLRSEALHLLVVEPSVLPVIQSFESAKLPEFEHLCRQQGMTLPARWTPDQLNILRQAVAQEKKLQPLLKKHRLGAMIQLPLPERIATLRELAREDAGNPVWDQDIRTFETAWINELLLSNRRPGGATLPALQRTLRELTDPELRSKPSKEQIALVRTQVQKLLNQKLDEETTPLLDNLHHAYLASDPVATQEAIQAVAGLFAARNVEIPPEVIAQLSPAAIWVGQVNERKALVQQFNTACDDLRQALVEHRSVDALMALKRRAEAFEIDIPDEILWDLRTAVNNQEMRRQRKAKLAVLSALTFIICVGVGTTWGMNKFRNDREAERFAQSLAAAIKTGDIKQSQEILEALRTQAPWLSSRPEFTPLRDELAKLVTAETARAGEFKLLLHEVLETPPDQSDAMAVKKLSDLAKTPEDQKLVHDIHEKLNVAFLSDLSALSVQLNTFVTGLGPNPDLSETELKIQEFSDRLRKVKARPVYEIDITDTIAPVEKQIASTRLSLETRIKQLQQQKDQSTRMAEMPSHAKSAIRLASELDAFASDFPGASESRSFKQAAAHAGQWHAYQQWLILVKNWKYNFTDLGIDDVGPRLKDVDAYIREYPQSPVLADAVLYQDFLKRAANAQVGAGPIRKNFKSFVTNPLIANLWVVKPTAGKYNYYSIGEGKYKATEVASTVEVVLTDDFSQPVRKEFTPGQIRKPVPSPQAQWAQALNDQMVVMRDTDWPLFVAKALENAIHLKDIDPNVHVLLIRAALNMARETSWGIDEQVATLTQAVPKTPTYTSYWLDPASEGMDEKTAESQRIVNTAQKVTGLQDATKAAMAAMTKPMYIDAVGYAVVMGRPESMQALTTQTDLPSGAILQAMVPRASDGKQTIRKVGSVVNSKPQIDPEALTGLEVGMMIFIVKPVEVKP
jgi:hypothetical protein